MSNPPMSDATRQKIAQQHNQPLKGFAVIYEQKVEWGDMDAFKHVNNVVYYDYAQLMPSVINLRKMRYK